MRLAIALLGFAACSAPPAMTAFDGGGCGQLSSVPNQFWGHVPVGTQPSYSHNPPASGPHYPIWARYRAYDTVVPRGYYVHNLEHGGVALLHRPDAPADVIAALRAAYDALPDDPACGHKRALLTVDPELDDLVAIVAADVVFEATCVARDAILAFVAEHRGHGPEDVCAEGSDP